MDDKPQTVCLRYYGISPWEIEVIYNLFNGKFSIIQEETEQITLVLGDRAEPDTQAMTQISNPCVDAVRSG